MAFEFQIFGASDAKLSIYIFVDFTCRTSGQIWTKSIHNPAKKIDSTDGYGALRSLIGQDSKNTYYKKAKVIIRPYLQPYFIGSVFTHSFALALLNAHTDAKKSPSSLKSLEYLTALFISATPSDITVAKKDADIRTDSTDGCSDTKFCDLCLEGLPPTTVFAKLSNIVTGILSEDDWKDVVQKFGARVSQKSVPSGAGSDSPKAYTMIEDAHKAKDKLKEEFSSIHSDVKPGTVAWSKDQGSPEMLDKFKSTWEKKEWEDFLKEKTSTPATAAT